MKQWELELLNECREENHRLKQANEALRRHNRHLSSELRDQDAVENALATTLPSPRDVFGPPVSVQGAEK